MQASAVVNIESNGKDTGSSPEKTMPVIDKDNVSIHTVTNDSDNEEALLRCKFYWPKMDVF